MKGLKKNSRSFFNFWPLAAIVVVVFLFFWRFLLKNEVPFPGDFVVGIYYPWLDYKWGFPAGVPVKNPITADVPSFMYPMQTLAAQMLRSGQLPLWNPYILAGNPLLANFQSAPFSPANFLYFLFDDITAWSWQIILQHILAATFTYILLRRWGVSKAASVTGGIVFAFSGFNLIWSQWNGHALTAAFIPLILFFEDRFLDKAKYRDGLGVCLTLALQILSGYPQVIFYSLIAMGLLYLFRAKENIKTVFPKTLLLAVFCLLALGLTAFQILPGAELLKFSQREIEPHPYEWAFLPWNKVITFVAPDYYGNHSTENYWGPQDYTSNTGFVGVVALTLAIFSLFKIKTNKNALYAVTLGIIALILAFPTPVSVFFWRTGFFGLNAASAHRSLVLWNLAVALLSAFGMDRLLSKDKLPVKQIFLSFIPTFIILVAFALNALSLKGELTRGIDISRVAIRNLMLPSFVFAGVSALTLFRQRFPKLRLLLYSGLSFLLILELFYFGWKFTPFSKRDIVFPTTPVIEFLMKQAKPFRVTGAKVIPINMRMPYKLESLEGYDAVYPLRISQFLATVNGGVGSTNPLGRYGTVDNDTSHILDLVNTKYYLTYKLDEKGNPSTSGKIPARFTAPRFKVAYEDKSVAILQSKTALPRAYMVYSWEVLRDEKEILDRILDPNIRAAVLEEEPNIKGLDILPSAFQLASLNRVDYKAYSETRSTIEVETSAAGMLFVSDAYYPDWKAYIDGSEVKIYRANYTFRAVEIPGGKHTVEFIYRPESFWKGVKLAGISLGLLVLIYPTMLLVGRKGSRSYTQ